MPRLDRRAEQNRLAGVRRRQKVAHVPKSFSAGDFANVEERMLARLEAAWGNAPNYRDGSSAIRCHDWTLDGPGRE